MLPFFFAPFFVPLQFFFISKHHIFSIKSDQRAQGLILNLIYNIKIIKKYEKYAGGQNT